MTPFHLYLYGPSQGPIETSFESAEQRLAALQNLCFEPDGSFVWTRDGGREQLFGMIYDAAERIQYCELRGQCRLQTWRQLCHAIAGAEVDKMQVLRLPHRQLQDLQSFEEACLGSCGADGEISST